MIFFLKKKDQPKKVGFALALYLILAKRYTFFGTIFTITIKFVQLMMDLFLRFDPLSPSSWSGLYFNFQADFG